MYITCTHSNVCMYQGYIINVMKDLRGKCFKYECTEYCMYTFKMVSQSCWPSGIYICMYICIYVCVYVQYTLYGTQS